MTVGDLSSMSSGTNWDEAYYSPLSITTRAYFDDDLSSVVTGLKVVEEPGQHSNMLVEIPKCLLWLLNVQLGKTLSVFN